MKIFRFFDQDLYGKLTFFIFFTKYFWDFWLLSESIYPWKITPDFYNNFSDFGGGGTFQMFLHTGDATDSEILTMNGLHLHIRVSCEILAVSFEIWRILIYPKVAPPDICFSHRVQWGYSWSEFSYWILIYSPVNFQFLFWLRKDKNCII